VARSAGSPGAAGTLSGVAEEPLLATALGRLRHAVRRSASAHPTLYLPVARRRYPGAVVDGRTQIVIDGFTRSAVTFAVVAFQFAQNDHVRVAHHLHAAGHLIEAARRRVPTLVPVRPPEDTIVSALVREPGVTPRQFLKSYALFYERLVPYRDAFELASFEEVTSDLGTVIERVNHRFGTMFRAFRHDEASVRQVFELIDERARRPPWEPLMGEFLAGSCSLDDYRRERDRIIAEGVRLPPIPEERVQRPSEARRAKGQAARAAYLRPELAALRTRAERAYLRFFGEERSRKR